MGAIKGVTTLEGETQEKDVWFVVQRRSKLRNGFSLIMDEGLNILSMLDLTKHEYRIILWLISQMEFDNCCYITQTSMGETLSIAQSNISKTLKSLELKGLIFRETTNKGKSIRISAVLAWRGKADKEFSNQFSIDSEHLFDIHKKT